MDNKMTVARGQDQGKNATTGDKPFGNLSTLWKNNMPWLW